MLLVQPATRKEFDLSAAQVLCEQLAARGHKVVIDEKTLPPEPHRNLVYGLAPYLADVSALAISRILILHAEAIVPEVLEDLRLLRLDDTTRISAIGRFADHQARVGTCTKIAYALGRDPEMLDLAKLQRRPLLPATAALLFAEKVATSPVAGPVASLVASPRLTVVLAGDALEDPQTLPALATLHMRRDMSLVLLASGAQKDAIGQSRHADLPVFGLSELSPAALARRTDLAAVYSTAGLGERAPVFLISLLQSGKAVLDCTHDGALVASGAPCLRGPEVLAALGTHLAGSVVRNLEALAQQIARSGWLETHALHALEQALDLAAPAAHARPEPPAAQTVFVPTNGVGIGHAQRCSLIAAAMDDPSACSFAAFPSCMPLIHSRGFACTPLVQKSADHPQRNANDVVNYLRLRRQLRHGDLLVFDGGYVFDSIYRTVLENDLRAVWIRRELWQAGQSNALAMEREKAFASVIVPQEAFEELNRPQGIGHKTHRVGPIVQHAPMDATAREALREGLRASLKTDFDDLIVTMLGAGVAADRSAQVQMLCALAEKRRNCLHLVVQWPGARSPSVAFGWRHSRLVQSAHGLDLFHAADLVVSAAGYNSLHELVYHKIPAIFVPQMAPYMDDQERRARAASDRGFGVTVLAHELLALEREVAAFLNDGKAETLRATMRDVGLPDRGIAAAAAILQAERAP